MKVVFLRCDAPAHKRRDSSHFIIIDRPDVVVDGIRQAVQLVRNDSAADAADKKDNSAAVGVWRGKLDNLPGADA